MQHNSAKPSNVGDDMFVFEPLPKEKAEEISTPATGFWKEAFRRLTKNKGSMISLIVIILLTVAAIAGPFLNSYTYKEQDKTRSHLPPLVAGMEWMGFDGTDIHGVDVYDENEIDEPAWLGTDEFGRDLWTRVWIGTLISLFIAFAAAMLDLLIGVAYGAISAFFGGKVDDYMQRVIEILVGIPNLIVIILFIMILEPGLTSIILAMVITGWVNMARIVRGQILQLKNQEYMLASRTLGASNSRLMWKHLIPNTMGPIIVTLMFTIPTAIFFEAFLSFIGLGIRPPLASLGSLIEDGYQDLRIFPFKLIYPSIIISLVMISFNVLADGLRDALDPKMRE